MAETLGGRRYKLTKHARDMMSRRRVKQEDIESVLDNYHTSLPDKHRKTSQILIGVSDSGKELKLVVDKDSNPIAIITVIESS